MDVRDFCKAMVAELDRGQWGDIDPYLFNEIAAWLAGDELSPDAAALKGVLEVVLGQDVARGRRGPGRRGWARPRKVSVDG